MSFGTWSGDLAEPEGPLRHPAREAWARARVTAVRWVHGLSGTPRIITEARAWDTCARVGGPEHFRDRPSEACRVCGMRGWRS